MKVKTLRLTIEDLLKLDPEIDNYDIRILVSDSKKILGPSPSVGISVVNVGFDWNSGKLLIEPQQPLIIKTEEK